MDTDWLRVLDRIDDFHIERAKFPTAWGDWFSQFKILLRATAFDLLPDKQKVALLLMKCKGFKPVWEALEVDDDSIEFDSLVHQLNLYFTPVYARNTFFGRRQRKNESFEDFARALTSLSIPCNFKDSSILRDALLLNMNYDHAQIAEQILAAKDPSFEEALHLAKSLSSEPESESSYSTDDAFVGANRKYARSVTSTKMVRITEGTHEVEIIGFGPNDVVFVVPTSMQRKRRIFLDELQRLMAETKEPYITPVKGASYSVLANCKWHRVIVLSIEPGKTAKAESIDFGWTKTLPFSVFRNTPLDCRVVDPLIWTISFKRRAPAQVVPGAILPVRLSQVNNNWVATLVETPAADRVRRSKSPQTSGSGDDSINSRFSKLNISGPKRLANYNSNNNNRTSKFQGNPNRDPQERDSDGTRNDRTGPGNPPRNPYRGQDDAAKNPQENGPEFGKNHKFQKSNHCNSNQGQNYDGRFDKRQQSRNSNSDQYRDGNRLHQQSKNQNDLTRKSLEFDDEFDGNNQSMNGYQSDNKPSNGFAKSNQPWKNYPANSQPKVDNGFAKNNQPRDGGLGSGDVKGMGRGTFAFPKKPPVFTPRPVELHQAKDTPIPVKPNRPDASEFSSRLVKPPLPLHEFAEVAVTIDSKEGQVFGIPRVKTDEFTELHEELQRTEKTPLHHPQEGMWCLAYHKEDGDFFRAEIIRIHPSGERAKVFFVDFGNLVVVNMEDMKVLPKMFQDIPAYGFKIKARDPLEAAEGDFLKVKLLSKEPDAEGTWLVEVDQPHAVSAPPTRSASVIKSPTPPKRPQLPPISPNTFTPVRVVYSGREGIFVAEESKCPDMVRIQEQIAQLPKAPVHGVPNKSGIYIAPFEGGFYRASVLSVNGNMCTVSFVDFGNEAEVPVKDLCQLPKPLRNHLHTFKIALDPDSKVEIAEGVTLNVSPVVMEPNGAWRVQLQGDPADPDHALPSDESIKFSRR